MAKILERNGKKEVIRDILCGVINQKVGLKIEFTESSPQPEPPPVQERPQRAPSRPAAPPMSDGTRSSNGGSVVRSNSISKATASPIAAKAMC